MVMWWTPELAGGAGDVYPAGFPQQVQQGPPPLLGCQRSVQAHEIPCFHPVGLYVTPNIPGPGPH